MAVGLTTVHEDLAAGQAHQIVEPWTVQVTPSSRHLPADGTSRATVRVRPRGADGSDATGVAVSVALDGPGTVVGSPAPHVDGGWSVEVQAPATVGRTRIEVRLDGRLLEVRPALWFDSLP